MSHPESQRAVTRAEDQAPGGSPRRRVRIRLLSLIALLTAAATVLPQTGASAAPTAGAKNPGAGYTAMSAKAPAVVARTGAAVRNAPGGPSAAHLDGLCQTGPGVGDLCVFTGVNFTGALGDFFFATAVWPAPFFNGDFSAFNADTLDTAWICNGVNFTGTCLFLAPFTGGNAVTPAQGKSNFWTA